MCRLEGHPTTTQLQVRGPCAGFVRPVDQGRSIPRTSLVVHCGHGAHPRHGRIRRRSQGAVQPVRSGPVGGPSPGRPTATWPSIGARGPPTSSPTPRRELHGRQDRRRTCWSARWSSRRTVPCAVCTGRSPRPRPPAHPPPTSLPSPPTGRRTATVTPARRGLGPLAGIGKAVSGLGLCARCRTLPRSRPPPPSPRRPGIISPSPPTHIATPPPQVWLSTDRLTLSTGRVTVPTLHRLHDRTPSIPTADDGVVPHRVPPRRKMMACTRNDLAGSRPLPTRAAAAD